MLKLGELVAYLKGDNTHLKGKLDQGRRELVETGDKMKASAAKIGAALGLAMGAAFLANMTLGQGMTGGVIAARLGVTDPSAIAQYGALAGKVYADNFGQSIEEVGDAIALVARSAVIVPSGGEAEIQEMSEKALTLTGILGQDLPRVIAAVESMIRSGIAKNATEAFDLLTKGVQTGADKSEDLADTFTEYSTMFRDLGLTGAESMGLMNQAIAAGARNSDVAADALKEFAIRGQDASTLSAQGFKLLGMDAQRATADIAAGGERAADRLGMVLLALRNMEDPVQRNAAAVALFGTKAEDLGDALFAMDLDTATQQLGDFQGATEDAANAVGQTAGAQLETFKRKVQEALVQKLAIGVGWLMQAAHWYRENESTLRPVVITLGVLVGVFGTMIAVARAYAAVQAILNITMLGFPVVWIVLGIIALIAAVVLLWQNWDKIWGWIKSKAMDFWEWMKDLPNKLADMGAGLVNILTWPYRTAFNAIADFWNATVGKLSWTVPSWVPFIGGNTISAPHLPHVPELAEGGIIPATPGGRLVRAAEAGQDEAFMPVDKLLRAIAEGGRRRDDDATSRRMVRELAAIFGREVRKAIEGANVLLDGRAVGRVQAEQAQRLARAR